MKLGQIGFGFGQVVQVRNRAGYNIYIILRCISLYFQLSSELIACYEGSGRIEYVKVGQWIGLGQARLYLSRVVESMSGDQVMYNILYICVEFRRSCNFPAYISVL